MRVDRLLLLTAALTGVWSLACMDPAEAPSTPDEPTEAPEPEPEPEPTPEPAPNAEKCASWQGAALPLEGGVIVTCSPKKVVIDHPDGDALKLRWEYAGHYKKKGWSQGDPKDNNPTVVKYPQTLVFKAAPNLVTIELLGAK